MNIAVEFNSVSDFTHLNDGDAFRAPLAAISPVPWGNIRKKRDPEAFSELRASIRQSNGVTQGITVRLDPNNSTKLQLLAGYGRVEAAGLEGFSDVPATFKIVDDKGAKAIMMAENLVREDLSLADEIEAAQQFISHFDGDYDAAAADLNWSVKRLRGRLLLNNCTPAVLDALRSEQIGIGHAEILSAFTAKLQDGTLEKIITESWSLEYLKERAGKANRVLKNAIFDINECKGCPHNSEFQAELFDNTVGKAKCNNLVCFREKTDNELAGRKQKLEEEYGVVLLAIEKPDSDRNTVSTDIVGELQFADGCTGCASNIVVMRDGINSDAGHVMLNQCIDTNCFQKMKAANAEAVGPSDIQSTPLTKLTSASTNKNSKTDNSGAGKAVAIQNVPKGVTENNRQILRQISAGYFEGNTHFMDAITVSSLISQTGFSMKPELFTSIANVALSNDSITRILQLYALSKDALDEIKLTCYSEYLIAGDSKGFSTTELLLKALSLESNGDAEAIKGWCPTKENLAPYTKQSLTAIALKSGMAAYYDANHEEKSFAKIANGKKDDLIQVMTRSQFDWSSFAPDDYVSCLK